MAKNGNLGKARKQKNDEFYTSYDDIKKELINYSKYFKDKTIYCNCDDHNGIGFGTPKSNFLKYLADNFQAFGLKKVIATHYDKGKKSMMYVLIKDKTGDGIICDDDIEEIPLKGDGDFRSRECIEFLKEADIVCTNPPFSLFREYVAQLVEYKKKFLIIGSDDCRTYKEIFPLIKAGQMWCGLNRAKTFMALDGTRKSFGKIGWYTNLKNQRQNDILNTGKQYKNFSKMYQKYDNYDAIEISAVKDIPMDYTGVMGVPITFLDKHNPTQFKIIGLIAGNIRGLAGIESKTGKNGPYINGKLKYGRILIQKIAGN